MKKRIGYLLISALTFVLGVVLSPIHFRLYSIGCGPKSSSSQFTSSYLLNLVSTERYYDSLEEADAAWQDELKKADSVIQQTAVLNRDEQKTGSRAVVTLNREDGKQYFGIIWTEKKVLRGVYSSWLRHVLAFEKRHF